MTTHTITFTYQVADAGDWGDAVEKVLRQPIKYLTRAQVKEPGRRLIHIAAANIQIAAQQLKENSNE